MQSALNPYLHLLPGFNSTTGLRATITPFASLPHEELARMLAAGDVETVKAAGDLWREAAILMQEATVEVRKSIDKLAQYFQGAAAEQHRFGVLDIADGIDTASHTVVAIRDLVHKTAEQLDTAQKGVTKAVDIPKLSPAASLILAARTGNPTPDAITWWENATPQQRAAVDVELQRYENAVEAASVGQQDLATRLTWLAGEYLTTEETMPHFPTTAESTRLPDDLASAQQLANQPWLTQDDTDDNKGRPLFSDAYQGAALTAASAYLGKQAGSEWLERRKLAKDAALAGLSGGGSSGGGGGGLSSGPPTANSAFSGGSGGVGSAGVGSSGLGGGAGGTAAGTGMGGMPMMPPMYPPMGGQPGPGNNPHLAAWLQEIEPIWGGESVPVTQAVIGAAPEQPPGGRPPWRPSIG
ncbi:MAG: hypothetical protein ACRC35_02235 [Angustibacter sp.]